jgi:AcrR family transcriptional regulator
MVSSSPTKERIKREAFLLFAANGFEATTMNEVASRVGVTKPAVYTYFSGKEDLVLSILEEVERDYTDYMKRVLEDSDQIPEMEKKLYHLFERYIHYFLDHIWISAFWVRIIFFPPPALKEKLAFRMKDTEAFFLEQLKSIFRKGMAEESVRKGKADQMALSFYALREGVLMLHAHKVGTPSLKEIWRNFWLGIGVGS